tara:strand:+ start:671 stop:844 length:174 start_codon:yes stop_codon:yes gene_type:complete
LNKKIRELTFITQKDFPIFCPSNVADTISMHPRVYINMDKKKEAACPYCGKVFRLKA